MGTKFAVVGSNLDLVYKKKIFFALLPQVYQLLLVFYCKTTLDFQKTFSINDMKILRY